MNKIYYRFHHDIKVEFIEIPSNYIVIADLSHLIRKKNKLDLEDCGLKIYIEEKELKESDQIPRNTSVIVERIPQEKDLIKRRKVKFYI